MSARETRDSNRAHGKGLSEETAWALVLACARHRRAGRSIDALAVADGGEISDTGVEDPESVLAWQAGSGWQVRRSCGPAAREMLSLYLPLCPRAGEPPLTVAHLGQSLDGFIATASGDSCYVNGQPNLLHLHRLRALCDAVLVGAGTIAADDPRLTTRLVPGDSPVRVVLGSRRSLDIERRVFRDGAADTLLVRPAADQATHGQARVLIAPTTAEGVLDATAVSSLLRARGLHTLFVEGGGVTVSRFLAAGVVDRLHLAVAPFLMGDGRPGVRLPGRERLAQCPRPRAQVFRMGDDVLFDLDLRASVTDTPTHGTGGTDAPATRSTT